MKNLILIILSLFTITIKSQTNNSVNWEKLKIDPIKEKMFLPYVEYNHSFEQEFQTWKKENKFQYIKEIWYYSESFYVIHHVNDEGVTIDESTIDITRFDYVRDKTKEVNVSLIGAGFNDTIVLLPANKLIYNLK